MNHRILSFFAFIIATNSIEGLSEKKITLDLYSDDDEHQDQDVSFNTRGFEKIRINIEDSYQSFALSDIYNTLSRICFPLCLALGAFLIYHTKKSPINVQAEEQEDAPYTQEQSLCSRCSSPVLIKHEKGGCNILCVNEQCQQQIYIPKQTEHITCTKCHEEMALSPKTNHLFGLCKKCCTFGISSTIKNDKHMPEALAMAIYNFPYHANKDFESYTQTNPKQTNIPTPENLPRLVPLNQALSHVLPKISLKSSMPETSVSIPESYNKWRYPHNLPGT